MYILPESSLSSVNKPHLESDGRGGVLVLAESHVEAGPTTRVAGVLLLLTEAGSLVENTLDVAAELQ